MKWLFLLCLAASAAEPPTVNVVVTVVSTNAAPTAPSPLPTPPPIPLSVQMRIAAQLARGKTAPWTQRFIVSAVEEKPATRADEDGPPVFSTNYLVTVVPITDETNTPVTWGTAKNKSIRFYTTSPTRKGDEFDLFPIKLP